MKWDSEKNENGCDAHVDNMHLQKDYKLPIYVVESVKKLEISLAFGAQFRRSQCQKKIKLMMISE